MALVRRGEIKADGIFEDLALIEGLRTTGRLKFRSGDIKGAVALVNGQLAAEQPSEEHLESLLALKEGEYQLHQELPPLPVSQGDSEERQGSLEVHVAADVMNYCERAGLTGSLRYQQDSASADIRYDAGEMNTIRLCGLEDLHEVFGWEKGTFVVRVEASISEASEPESATSDSGGSDSIEPKPSADSEAPTEKKPSLGDGSDAKVAVSIETPHKPAREDEATIEMALPPIFPTSDLPPMRHRDTLEDTGQQLLRIVEMSLAEIESEREERRPATRTSPPLPPLNPRDTPLPRKRRDQTVRILVVADPEDDIPTQKRQAVDARAAAKALKAPALKTQTTAAAPPRTDPNIEGDASARTKPTTPEAPPVQRAEPALPNSSAADPKEATKQPSLARPRAGSIQENPPRSKWPVVFLVALALLALGAALAMR